MLSPDVVFADNRLAAPHMVNASLTLPSAGNNKIWLGSEAIEAPTYQTAEAFVEKLLHRGILDTDQLVARLITSNPSRL